MRWPRLPDGQQSNIFEIKIMEPQPELLVCQAATADEKAAWVALFGMQSCVPRRQRRRRVSG